MPSASRRNRRFVPLATLLVLLLPGSPHAAGAGKDLRCSIAIIPGLADPPGKGPFVELAKAIAETYTDGKITIELYPFTRSVDNVISGRADFHIPNVQNPSVDGSKLPYRYSSKTLGRVDFVVYSTNAKVLTGPMLDDAIARFKAGAPFPYAVEVPGGIEANFPFPAKPSNDLVASLTKVSKGRIDAYVGAQEETDATLTSLKDRTIHRSQWQHFEDILTLPKGPRGEEIDRLLSPVIAKLEKSGRLQELHAKIHWPYKEWQPADMGW